MPAYAEARVSILICVNTAERPAIKLTGRPTVAAASFASGDCRQ